MLAPTATAFRRAVVAYRFEPVPLAPAAVASARAALSTAGFLLVGETHGVRETPAALYALAGALGARGLALEWSHEELDGFVQEVVCGSAFDLERLWSLPPSAEVFAGDGRFTAGHVALLERLRREERLQQAICCDRLDPVPAPGDPTGRERELAERLLERWDGSTPLLAVVGASHARLGGEPETMADHLARRVRGFEPAMLQYAAGECWFHGMHDASAPMPPAPIVFRLPRATPAVVPGPPQP